jgi:hypothetical protein
MFRILDIDRAVNSTYKHNNAVNSSVFFVRYARYKCAEFNKGTDLFFLQANVATCGRIAKPWLEKYLRLNPINSVSIYTPFRE